MTIYISGPITKNPDYKQDFMNAEAELNRMFHHKADIINPVFLTTVKNGSWEFYMRVCLKALADCDTIFMLKGWRRSKGARLEYKIAKKLNMKVLYVR